MFFHVIQQKDGSWSCSWGREVFDSHTKVEDAVDHMIGIASEHPLSEVLVHRLDGQVQSSATLV